MASLTALPGELLIAIFSYLAKEDLCTLRLTSKRLASSTCHSLFSTVRLHPSSKSIEKYNAMFEHPHISEAVRHVFLNTIEEDAEREEHSREAYLSSEYREAFQSFNRFPNLKSATLRFSNSATTGRTVHDERRNVVQCSNWPETTEFRQPILDQFFRTLADAAASNIKGISIRNIQNINDPALVKSKHFQTVLSRITSLRLFIITEHYDPGLEEDFTLPELYTFMDELVETWLQPCSANLTSLVLYSDQHFGYMPKLDLRGVHFPRLQTLALGNYMFSHAWQLDWLASHAATLQRLYLDDCSIVHYSLLYAHPDAEGYVANPLQPLPELQQRPVIRLSPLRWSHILDRLRTALHRLRTFRMGASGLIGWRRRHRRGQVPLTADASDPAVYTSLPLGLFPDRYLLCHMGMGPSWYTDLGTLSWPCEDEYGMREGDDELMAFVDRMEEGVLDREDKEALVRLVEGIGQGGADDVKGMMDRGWGWRDESVYGHI